MKRMVNLWWELRMSSHIVVFKTRHDPAKVLGFVKQPPEIVLAIEKPAGAGRCPSILPK